MKATITLTLSGNETKDVQATLVGPLGVHPDPGAQYREGSGWNVTHIATGLTVGFSRLPDEQAALDAAASLLLVESVDYVLAAITQEDASARLQETGLEIHLHARRITDEVTEQAKQRLIESGEFLSPEQVQALIEIDFEALMDVPLWDEVIELVEAADAEVKNALLKVVIEQDSIVYNCAYGYAEPGYGDGGDGDCVLFGDWNPKGGDRLSTLAEACGASIEWCDEWTECTDCGKAVRTQADSYSWTRSYVEWSGDITCHECLEDDDHKREFIEQELEGEPTKADTLDWDLEGLGYIRMDEDFQNGLYGGQSANPHKIASALRERGVERFVFQIDSVGQFDARFSCWLHEDEDMPALEESETDGNDPAVAMKAALQDASLKMSSLSGDGVKVATCNPDGTATVRMVSNEDFIAGKALD